MPIAKFESVDQERRPISITYGTCVNAEGRLVFHAVFKNVESVSAKAQRRVYPKSYTRLKGDAHNSSRI